MEKYSEVRVPDAHAICDLAVSNYEEMRYLVTTRKYKLRKQLDKLLNIIFPNSWIPLYSMVTFSRIRYSEVIEKKQKQDKVYIYDFLWLYIHLKLFSNRNLILRLLDWQVYFQCWRLRVLVWVYLFSRTSKCPLSAWKNLYNYSNTSGRNHQIFFVSIKF